MRNCCYQYFKFEFLICLKSQISAALVSVVAVVAQEQSPVLCNFLTILGIRKDLIGCACIFIINLQKYNILFHVPWSSYFLLQKIQFNYLQTCRNPHWLCIEVRLDGIGTCLHSFRFKRERVGSIATLLLIVDKENFKLFKYFIINNIF
jgi:hypothetical protein